VADDEEEEEDPLTRPFISARMFGTLTGLESASEALVAVFCRRSVRCWARRRAALTRRARSVEVVGVVSDVARTMSDAFRDAAAAPATPLAWLDGVAPPRDDGRAAKVDSARTRSRSKEAASARGKGRGTNGKAQTG
jgi:hypothetical protein